MNHKQYILAFSLIITVFIGSSFVADYFFRAIPNVYQFKHNKVKRDIENYTTVILGSSHSYYGVNPDYFEQPTLNLANVGQDLKYDKHILDLSLANLKGLKTVILPMSYISLFNNLDTGVEAWRKYFYVYWFDYPIEKRLDINNYNSLVSYPSKTKFLSLMQDYYIKDTLSMPWSSSGWGVDYTDENQEDLILTGIKAAKYHHMPSLYHEQNLSLFHAIIDACKAHNLQLILFTPPAYKTYRQHLDQQRLDDMLDLLRDTAKSNNNITYINLLADKRFVEKDYRDSDHLNHTGAKKLSLLLNTMIKESAATRKNI